ncbi:TPA: NHLP bacteriocin system secretion protein [Legionella pneumophila]|nr:NHLP bacteriocin system secretion protein [Legionella pneumophila]
MDNKNKITFRQEALEHQTTSFQLNQRLNIVSKSSWLLLYTIGLILLFIILWGFLGSIPTRIAGNGILLAKEGGLYNAVAPEGNGRLVSLTVKPGDKVKPDDVIAYLELPDLQDKISVARDYLNKLKADYVDLNKQFHNELQSNTQALDEQEMTQKKIIASETKKLNYFSKLLETKQTAFKKGLITQDSVAQTLQMYHDTQTQINQAYNNLEEIKIRRTTFVSQWKQRLDALKLKVEEQDYKIKDLTASLVGAKEVKSPIAGVITSIQATIGEKVDGGQVVATIATLANDLDAIIYVPAENGKRIKEGMPILISPTNIKKEEYGSIVAQVTQVSLFPISPKAMMTVLQNDELVKEFSKEGAIIALRAHLTKDNSTYSGYSWTSSQGPNQVISAGTLVSALITVKTQAPITLVLPAFKKLLGE